MPKQNVNLEREKNLTRQACRLACNSRENKKLQHGRHVQVNFFEGAGKKFFFILN